MKKVLASKMNLFVGLAIGLLMFCMVGVANATAVYISGDTEPWGVNSNLDNMNTAFGADWARLTFNNAIALGAFSNPANTLVYIDGGDGATLGFENFVNNNRGTIENWVSNGGSVFINAARWDEYSPFDLGFGATLKYSPSLSGIATGSHPIFDATTGTSWTGSYFAHDFVSGIGLTSLINGTSGSVLSEMDYGQGHAMFGGMTSAYFQQNNAQANALRVNILEYGAEQGNTKVPEPATMLLFGTGLAGLGLLRKRFKS